MHLNTLKFAAIPQASYTLPINNSSETAEVTIYELEARDKPLLNVIQQRVDAETLLPSDNGDNNQSVHYITLADALTDAKKALPNRDNSNQKVLMAVQNQQPCGLLVGDPYHSITWLVTWPLGNIQERLIGVGKCLVLQFFDLCEKVQRSPIYVKSTSPKESIAVRFYKSMGFSIVTDGNQRFVNMILSPSTRNRIVKQYKTELPAKNIGHTPLPIREVIDLDRFKTSVNPN